MSNNGWSLASRKLSSLKSLQKQTGSIYDDMVEAGGGGLQGAGLWIFAPQRLQTEGVEYSVANKAGSAERVIADVDRMHDLLERANDSWRAEKNIASLVRSAPKKCVITSTFKPPAKREPGECHFHQIPLTRDKRWLARDGSEKSVKSCKTGVKIEAISVGLEAHPNCLHLDRSGPSGRPVITGLKNGNLTIQEVT